MVTQYSTLFSCLYDEQEPVGSLGRGTHYSVFRSVEWLDVSRHRLEKPQVHDFAVIWDEDHDTRVIKAIEKLYMEGLLSPIQFIGERKGMLATVLAAKFYWGQKTDEYDHAIAAVGRGMMDSVGDSWSIEIGCFDRAPGNPHQNFYGGIIASDERRVGLYLKNIDSLWSLGTKPWASKVIAPWSSVPAS